MAKVVLLDTPAAHFDAGFCNGLMMLASWIRDNEKSTAQTKRILEMITELAGEPKHEN
jgi:hypothetical protein